jgi:hypothetical protein
VVVDSEGELDRDSSRRLRLDMDGTGEATELGGFRVPSVMTDTLDGFHEGRAVAFDVCESCDCTLHLFFLVDTLDLGYRFLIASGTPSHFEFTLGMSFGSFFAE